MTSASALGYVQITLQFELSRQIDGAVSASTTVNGKLSELTPSTRIGVSAGLTLRISGGYGRPVGRYAFAALMADSVSYAQNILLQKLSQIPGVGLVGRHKSHRPRSAHSTSCSSPANHGWSLRTARSSGRRRRMEAQLPLARRTALARRLKHSPSATPRQLDLILDDTRFRGMTLVERQAVLRALARLLLEASGVAMQEASDDNA